MPAAATPAYKRYGRRLLFGLNLLLLLPLILAMLAPWVNADQWWLPTVLSLAYPWWLVLPLLLGIGWLPFSRRYALFNLLLLALNYPVWTASWQSNSPSPPDDRDVRVVSYNADAFGYRHERVDELVRLLKPLDPQVLCLQEFRDALDGDHEALPVLEKELKYKHHAFVELVPESGFGLMVFSRFPIVSHGRVDTDTLTGNGMMYADLLLYGDTMRVYNLHLLSYRFSVGQRHVLGYGKLKGHSSSRQRKSSWTPSVRSLWQVVKIMLSAWTVHIHQTEDLLKHVRNNRKPTLICADLNNPPYTWVYRKVRGDNLDLFMERGSGFGRTWGHGLLSFRIDHMFCNGRLSPREFRALPRDGLSDHSPLYARLRFDFHR